MNKTRPARTAKVTHLPRPRRSCRDCSSRGTRQIQTRRHFCIRSRGPRGCSRIPIRRPPRPRLRLGPRVSRRRCWRRRMRWRASTRTVTTPRRARFWCVPWGWRCETRMWGKDPPYKCRDGRTCLRSKSLAGASLDSRRHARRDHRVLIRCQLEMERQRS